MTKVVAFVNSALGAAAVTMLKEQLVAVVLHAKDRCRDEEVLRTSIPPSIRIFTASDDLAALLPALQPTHGVSILYGHILKQAVLNVFPHGIANLHTSFLPYGRGAHPNAWAIAAREPAGVSLHLIDAGIDTGPILAQRRVEVHPTDTAKDLYQRLMLEAERLMRTAVPDWLHGRLKPVQQSAASTQAHKVSDLDRLLRIDPDKTYTGREIIDLLRARTFIPHAGAPYEVDGQRLRVRIDIQREGLP
jgi:methionyl-tRNA formyltransferase